MSAQFFSSLADNALFVAAVELLKTAQAPDWQPAALVPMFALFYVVLAPFVGAFADALPKGRVMFFSNLIKMVGCLLMLFGSHPLIAYAIVGLGAAAYSPAKYGILTELLPNSQLVKANGWIEGLTIGSIILGVLLGGQLVGPVISQWLLAIDVPGVSLGIASAPEAAIAAIILLYAIAALFNLKIPRTDAPLQPVAHGLIGLVRDFSHCNARLWNDKLGQISLATTTLFWGVSGNLRYIVLAWAAVALGYGTSSASALVGVVALGTAAGAVVASVRMRLDQATSVMPLGILMGLLVIAMNFISNVWVAAPFLVLLGAIGGYMVVPMNALLQHRGHNLMGAGRSIAVQNFNEQACILGLGALYAGLTSLPGFTVGRLSGSFEPGSNAGLALDWLADNATAVSVYTAITILGLIVAGTMWLIRRWHATNCVEHAAEVDRLLAIARSDTHH